MHHRPTPKRFLDEFQGTIFTPIPIGGICDSGFEESQTKLGSGPDTKSHLVSRRNTTEMRNRQAATAGNQAVGGSQPGGAAKRLRTCPRRPAEIARSNSVLAAIQSGHCLYFSRIVCCEGC